MVVKNGNKEIIEVVMSFVDYLFKKSHYQVYEIPKTISSKLIRRGYRGQTSETGDSRRKAINWSFQLITPSRQEIETYVKFWLVKNPSVDIPDDSEKWNLFVSNFVDEFITKYLIMESPQITVGGDYRLNYRPMSRKLDSRVHFYAKFLQPNKEEMDRVIRNWLETFFR